jgi:hypothetical protein
MDTKPYDFTQHFENKTESELQALKEPPGLPTLHLFRWRKERDAAVAALRRARVARETAEKAALAAKWQVLSDLVDGDDALAEEQRDVLVEEEPVQMPSAASRADETVRALAAAIAEPFVQKQPVELLPPQPGLVIPEGNVADLLERQVGICAALIGNIADYVARNDTSTEVCFPFMDRISSMLTSSATAARVVGQLRGIATETKQTFIKKGEREGGVLQT